MAADGESIAIAVGVSGALLIIIGIMIGCAFWQRQKRRKKNSRLAPVLSTVNRPPMVPFQIPALQRPPVQLPPVQLPPVQLPPVYRPPITSLRSMSAPQFDMYGIGMNSISWPESSTQYRTQYRSPYGAAEAPATAQPVVVLEPGQLKPLFQIAPPESKPKALALSPPNSEPADMSQWKKFEKDFMKRWNDDLAKTNANFAQLEKQRELDAANAKLWWADSTDKTKKKWDSDWAKTQAHFAQLEKQREIDAAKAQVWWADSTGKTKDQWDSDWAKTNLWWADSTDKTKTQWDSDWAKTQANVAQLEKQREIDAAKAKVWWADSTGKTKDQWDSDWAKTNIWWADSTDKTKTQWNSDWANTLAWWDESTTKTKDQWDSDWAKTQARFEALKQYKPQEVMLPEVEPGVALASFPLPGMTTAPAAEPTPAPVEQPSAPAPIILQPMQEPTQVTPWTGYTTPSPMPVSYYWVDSSPSGAAPPASAGAEPLPYNSYGSTITNLAGDGGYAMYRGSNACVNNQPTPQQQQQQLFQAPRQSVTYQTQAQIHHMTPGQSQYYY